jgi:small-conductance mechanosensitive channel
LDERPLLQRVGDLLDTRPLLELGLRTTFAQILVALLMVLIGCALMGTFRRVMRRARDQAGEDRRPPGKGFERAVDGTIAAITLLFTLEALGIGVRSALNFHIIDINSKPVTPMNLLIAVVFVVGSLIASRMIRATLVRTVGDSSPQSRANVRTVGRLVHYLVVLIGLALALQHTGVDLTTLVAFGGVIAIAVGFAMQNIAENFISGVILLVERVIKPGDVLELQDDVVQVVSMGIRTTVVRTRDGEDVVVPNSLMVSNPVKNYTLRDSQFRLRTTVGVAYESDMKLVFETLRDVATRFERRISNREPQVFMKQFGSNSVDFDVCVWMEDPWTLNTAMSDLNRAIWFALADAGITIAYPQLDLHLDQRSLAALTGGQGRATGSSPS